MNDVKADQWNSKLYDEKHHFVYQYGNALVNILDPKPFETILDLGCGSGHLTHEIAKSGCNVVGIDQSPSMIKLAKTKYPEIKFHIQKAETFRSKSKFDAIFSNATLHWILDYQSVIASMYENLKCGGRLVLEMGGSGNIRNIIDMTRQVLEKYEYFDQAKKVVWFFPTIGQYVMALEEVGFTVNYAQLFGRWTELKDKENGIVDWLNMFGGNFFENVESNKVREMQIEIQSNLRPLHFENGSWYADYKRLQIIATK